MAEQTLTQRRATARKAAATRKRSTTASERSATSKKAAATRRRNATAREADTTQASAKQTAKSAARTVETGAEAGLLTLEYAGRQAERAVLIPVGATLAARDNVVGAVRPYTKRRTAERQLSKLQRQLKTDLNKFERRGSTARKKAQRELRQRRDRATRLVGRQVGELQKSVSSALP